MVMATYQYAWSRTHTKLTHEHNKLVSEKSHSCGPNYTLGVEYYVDDHWAINCGIGYNISLSKEKHGLRGKGAKLGVAYYF
jgi:long-subunit fatty acid transport protein